MEELRIIHDSQKMNYRKPFGAVESGEKVKIALYINRDTEVILQIIKSDGLIRDINMDKEYLNDGSFKYFAEVDTSDYIGLLEYYFVIIQGYDRVYYGNNDERLGGIGQVYNYNPIPYQITVYEKSIVPDWYKEGVISLNSLMSASAAGTFCRNTPLTCSPISTRVKKSAAPDVQHFF